jgi:hypothetical protein
LFTLFSLIAKTFSFSFILACFRIIIACNACAFYSSSVALSASEGGSLIISSLKEEYSSNLELLFRDKADESSVGDRL